MRAAVEAWDRRTVESGSKRTYFNIMGPTLIALTVACVVLRAWLAAGLFAVGSLIAVRVLLADKDSVVWRALAAVRALTRRP
jgi:hypothetical protein